MNTTSMINIGTGMSLTFLGTGGLRYLASVNLDRCTKVNTTLGLSTTVLTGLLYVYRGFK